MHPLWSNLFRRRPPWREEAGMLLASTPLCEGLPARALTELTAAMHLRRYGAGERIFDLGDPGLGMYLVLAGTVEIRLRERPLARLERGDFFGEVALFGEEERTAAAYAQGPCELAGLFRPDLEEWLARRPRQGVRLLLNLGRLLAERLRHSNACLSGE